MLPGLVLTEVSTPVVWAVAVACRCRLAAVAPLVKTLASNSRLNWRVALTAAWATALPVRLRLVTLGMVTVLMPLAEMLTVAAEWLMSARLNCSALPLLAAGLYCRLCRAE